MSAADVVAEGAPRVGWLLAGGLGAVVAAERHRLAGLGRSVLFVRWCTWAVITGVAGVAVAWRPAAVALVGAAGVQGAREYARLTRLPALSRWALLGAATASALVLGLAPDRWGQVVPLLLLGVALAALLAGPAVAGSALAHGVLGAWFVPVLLGHLVLLRDAAGPGALLAVVLATACSDVGAYVAGRTLKSAPLAPSLSPAKTRGGVAGNVMGAAVGLLVSAPVLPDLTPPRVVLLAGAIAVGAVLGDLLESLLKRQAGVKDAGSWLPGFGGLLDRVDSLLVTAPLSLWVLS